TGCFISNELVDAFPLHRVVMSGSRLQEAYVVLENDSFVEALAEPSTPALAGRLAREGVALAEGYRTEVSLEIDPWMEEVAGSLDKGFVLTIDYGHPAIELYAPHRGRGTLVTYYRHTCGSDPYARVGEQDITAHVDFTALALAGERGGLRCQALLSQRDFLLNLGHSVFVEALAFKRLGQREQMANRLSMLELVREEGMGGFKVLVQSKGVAGGLPLFGATRDNQGKRDLRARRDMLEAPLLDAEHMPLLLGRYPQYGTDNGQCGPDR
ncbi:MAG: SAM-dependent methyltransferase, partial [Dehalococcoidales bacterium]|nr:SAM-dependent methyltransferase [Dehalococcoidales bacterium]